MVCLACACVVRVCKIKRLLRLAKRCMLER
jgi:hypothetical protein